MPANIDQVENAWLDGNSSFEEWMAKFDAEFFAPVERRSMRMAWETMTDQERALLKAIAPDAYANVEEQMKMMES